MNYCKEKLDYKSIKDLYIGGYTQNQLIGFEYERLPLDELTNETIPYFGEFGIKNLLEEFSKLYEWDCIYDGGNIIGLKKLHDTITLEPGCQIEYSLTPQQNVDDLKTRVEQLDSSFGFLRYKYGIRLFNYGVSPVSTYKHIQLMPKRRYKFMANYLWGILSDVMMRETAGIQVGIDFASEEDAMEKFLVANLLSPFMTAIFANSKFRGGVDTGYKSFRALAWLNTDNERCGFATKLVKDITFDDYINSILDTPMIFIKRNDNLIYLDGKITFSQFLNHGYDGYDATIEDYRLHANMCFPDVRLREFVEIRNHDCVGDGLDYSIPAIYKGIFYNKNAMNEIKNLLKDLSGNDIAEFRYNIPRFALNATVKDVLAKDIANEILNIAYQSLLEETDTDSDYILPIMELTKKGIIPADINTNVENMF